MEGRREEKLAFGHLELCTLITGIINTNILPIILIFSNLDIIHISFKKKTSKLKKKNILQTQLKIAGNLQLIFVKCKSIKFLNKYCKAKTSIRYNLMFILDLLPQGGGEAIGVNNEGK